MKTVFLLLVSLVLISCRTMNNSKPEQFTEAPLFGMIYDSNSSPAAGAKVILDGKDSAMSDINGRFLLYNVSRGPHILVIQKQGFEETRTAFNFTDRGQVLYSKLISDEYILDRLESDLKSNQMEEAASLLKRAQAVNRENIRLHYLKIIYLAKKREYKKALEETEALRKVFPADSYLVMTQAKILFFGMQQKGKTIDLLKDYLVTHKSKEVQSLLKLLNPDVDTGEKKEGQGENNDE